MISVVLVVYACRAAEVAAAVGGRLLRICDGNLGPVAILASGRDFSPPL